MLLAFALAACSSDKGPVGSGSPSPSPSVSGGTPGATTSPGSSKSSSPRPGATRTGGGGSPRANPTFGPASAKLDKSCARRGVSNDEQGVTVKADPEAPVSYYTVYSDGSSIQNRPGVYNSGGQFGGFADASGTYRDTWVVPVAAPTGRAVVRVTVPSGNKVITIDLPFLVESQTGTCP